MRGACSELEIGRVFTKRRRRKEEPHLASQGERRARGQRTRLSQRGLRRIRNISMWGKVRGSGREEESAGTPSKMLYVGKDVAAQPGDRVMLSKEGSAWCQHRYPV